MSFAQTFGRRSVASPPAPMRSLGAPGTGEQRYCAPCGCCTLEELNAGTCTQLQTLSTPVYAGSSTAPLSWTTPVKTGSWSSSTDAARGGPCLTLPVNTDPTTTCAQRGGVQSSQVGAEGLLVWTCVDGTACSKAPDDMSGICADAPIPPVGSACVTPGGATGVTDVNNNCVHSAVNPGDDCLMPNGCAGQINGALFCQPLNPSCTGTTFASPGSTIHPVQYAPNSTGTKTNPTGSAPTSTTKEATSSKVPVMLGIGAAVALVAGGGVYLWRKKHTKKARR